MAPLRVEDDGLRALYEAHYRRLVRMAALLVDDLGTAEEVVQDAFVATHAKWDHIDDAKAVAYLRSAVLNGARSCLRRRGTVRRFLDRQRSVEPPADVAAEAAAMASVTRQAVLDEIRRLPETQRNVVLLRYFLDASEAEIAEALGVAPGTVKTSAHRALAKLAPALEDLR